MTPEEVENRTQWYHKKYKEEIGDIDVFADWYEYQQLRFYQNEHPNLIKFYIPEIQEIVAWI